MHPGEVVLSVDYGSACTVAVLVGPDGAWTSVPAEGVDGPLASAVFLSADGSWVTGERAWQLGAGTPQRFESSPVRWLRQGRASLDGVEVEAVDAVAATLQRVAGQATARLGSSPLGEVRLVVPAGWGPRRRTAMREAARRAGWGQASLVDAPSAAGSHLVAGGASLRVGSFLVVCDWGGGFTASVLRRTPYGFETLSTIEAADAGGLALDQVLAGQLPVLAAAAAGGSVPADGYVAVWAAARGAREALSMAAAVTVSLPWGPPVVVTAAGAHESFRPVAGRAADAVRAAIGAAEVPVSEVAGVFCVGGVARCAVMVDMLGQETGLTVSVVEDPQRAAVLGAAHASGPGVDAAIGVQVQAPVPGWWRPAVASVPGVASMGLMTQFLLSAQVSRAPGIAYDPYSYILANWGELAMAGLLAMVTCLTIAPIIAAAIPDDDPLAEPGVKAGGEREQQIISTALLAAVGLGLSVACAYAVLASAIVHWSNAPFLRWALLPVGPLAAVIAVTAGLATRHGRIPRDGWHRWLDFPAISAFTAALGMVLVQAADTTPAQPSDAALLQVMLRGGAILIMLGAAMAVVRRWRYRLSLATPLAVFASAVVGPPTTGVLACLYVAAATVWWTHRAWQLAIHPHRSPPRLI
jgi:hypothetical protein